MVIGPGGRFYLTDRHHLSSALWRLDPKQGVPVKVIGATQATDFWKKMRKTTGSGCTMRVARRSRPRRCRTLSPGLRRSLPRPGRLRRDENAFDKDRQSYFIEFHWARYFGERMHWRPISRATLPDDLKQALPGLRTGGKELPGYRQDCPR